MTIATNTADIIPTNWSDRLAVINEFKLSNAAIAELFHTTDADLALARGLVQKSLLTITPLSAKDRARWAPFVSSIPNAAPTVPTQTTLTVAPSTTVKAPTTRKTPIPGAKRGRTGSKIINALNAIPSTPQPIETFIATYGISKTVLRQSKRFLDTAIKVSIKKDKATGVEMICRK